jgi:hypothetical protein
MKKISRKDKIIYTILKFTKGKNKSMLYEDIIIKTYKLFPLDFHIQNYPEYPDSDIFRREIYFDLRKKGLIKITNKKCSLTELGEERARSLDFDATKSKKNKSINVPLSNSNKKEFYRLSNLQGFKMFINNESDKIVDQDYYDFFKISVRTSTLEAVSKIKQADILIKKLIKLKYPFSEELKEYSDILKNNFMKSNHIEGK